MDKTATTEPVTTAPAATPAATTPPPTDPVKTSTLAAVLGLVKPEDKDVRPVVKTEDSTSKHVDALKPKPESAATPITPAATEPAKPAAAEPAKPAPVAVKKKASIEEVVRKQLDEARAKQVAQPVIAPVEATKPAVAAPTVDPDADLLPDEREELELAAYAEKKDPAKKGLADQFRKFFKAQKEFLEQRTAKATEDGEDYDPSSDPEFKKFLQKNEPKLAAAERKKLNRELISEQAEARAAQAAEARMKPEIEKLERKTRELEHRPQIESRVTSYVTELVDGMPEDVVKFYKESGNDIEKTKAEFPLEFDIILDNVTGAQALAKEFLSVRRGLKEFNPAKEEGHAFLRDFVAGQGDVYAKMPAAETSRGGRQFIHPSLWQAGMEKTHWTFDDDDVLEMLKARAARDARRQIEMEEKRQAARGFVRAKRVAAPVGAPTAPAAPVKPEVAASPRTPTASLPGAASATPAATGGALSRVLGY